MSQTLQQKNTRFLFYRLLLVLLGCSVLFYFLMHMQARHMQHKQLDLNQLHFRAAFIKNPAMPWEIPGEYTIADSGFLPPKALHVTRDTSLYYEATHEWLPFEVLTEDFQVGTKRYQLTTYVSSTEISHLIIKVFLIEACILALLFGAIIYINRKTAGVLWRPFRTTMQKLAGYDITQHHVPVLEKETGIVEFNELNKELTNLIEKDSQAYHSQKQFVENASHELQTPLAIIRSKLELLINQRDLTEETASLLADITDANDRLSQMNKNLLLLAKIGNNQFPDKQPVCMGAMLDRIIDTYRQHYQEDFPAIKEDIDNSVIVQANTALMEIFLGNLVKNAVIHNVPNGFIEIELNMEKLVISNTGRAINLDPELLFERFRKGSNEIKSTGLGLALVKQICHLYNFFPEYTFSQGIHSISIRINNL